MSRTDRAIEQRAFIYELADTLLFDAKRKQLSSVEILRHIQMLVASLIVEIEHPTQNGRRFGHSCASSLVVSALKRIDSFASTPDEGVLLQKRLIEALVINSVAGYEIWGLNNALFAHAQNL